MKPLEVLCAYEVTRKGGLEPCDRPGIAYRLEAWSDTLIPYPVCELHVTKVPGMMCHLDSKT